MITFLTGVPGSGKSNLAVRRMLDDKMEVHTNITMLPAYPNEYKVFIWDDFLEKITQCHKLQDDYDAWVQLSKDLGIFNISIYFDECHTKLDKQNRIVVWWFSIHRHMSQEICLITQNKGAVAQKYRLYPEIFIDSHKATARFFTKLMTYSEYSDYAMSKKNKIRKFSHKIDPVYFTYYKTGKKNVGINTLRKKVYWILAFFLVPIFMFAYILTMFKADTAEELPLKNKITSDLITTVPKIKSHFYIDAEILGDNLMYNGWFFKLTHVSVRNILLLPHKAHKISMGYIKLQFDKKYSQNFKNLVASRSL